MAIHVHLFLFEQYILVVNIVKIKGLRSLYRCIKLITCTPQEMNSATEQVWIIQPIIYKLHQLSSRYEGVFGDN